MEELFIIKIGGNVIDDEKALDQFLLELSKVNKPIILIHGGGKLATDLAVKMQQPQQMIDGRRVTDAETLKLVTMVYAGYINKLVVAKLQANNCNAFGLSGADGNLISAQKRQHPTIDYGFVGDVKSEGVNNKLLQNLLQIKTLPVVAPITHNNQGQLLNTNADTIANQIAIKMSELYKTSLLFCFNKNGVLRDVNDDNSVINEITPLTASDLKSKGIISTGMIPKIDNAIEAIQQGVNAVTIGNANDVLNLISKKSGTTIKAN